jgi:hypothetical protein
MCVVRQTTRHEENKEKSNEAKKETKKETKARKKEIKKERNCPIITQLESFLATQPLVFTDYFPTIF